MLKSVIVGVALGAFGFLSTAQASLVTVTYSGQITMGNDATNTFGTASTVPSGGVDLGGQFLSLTYVFDTSKGVYSNVGGIEMVSGGGAFPGVSPAISASVTINNTTVSFSGAGGGSLSASDAYGASMLSQSAQYDTDTYVSSTLMGSLGSFRNSITSPLTIALGSYGGSDPYAYGSFSVNDGDVSGFFEARSLTISAVPLPSALPLFGLALAGLGTAAAFRKRHGLRASL